MNLKILTDKKFLETCVVKKGEFYEVLDIVQNTYKIAVPMKRKGKFKHVLINEDEGELVD